MSKQTQSSEKAPSHRIASGALPAYHSFPVIPGSEKEGFSFGRITHPRRDSTWGDAFVVAPDGSRAGVIWRVGTSSEPCVSVEPDADRWGVYSVEFPVAAQNLQQLVRNLQRYLPHWKELFAAARQERPVNSNAAD